MWVPSFRMILRQQRITYILLFIIGFIGALVAYITFPGEEGIQALVGMADTAFAKSIFGELLANLDSDNSAFFLYFIFLYFLAYMTNVYPVVGIWLGGSGTPNEVKSGMADIFIASPHKKEKLVLRHVVAHLILLTFFTLLIYILIPISFSLLKTNINYERMFWGYILLWISGLMFFSIAFFLASITLKSDISRGLAGLIFILSFLINLIINMNPNFEDLKYLNILHYTNPNPILLLGEKIEFDNLIPLIISIFLLIFGVIIFRSRDLLPLELNRKHLFTKKNKTKGLKNIYSKIRMKLTVKDYTQNFLHKVSPISGEQWVADRMIFVVFLILCFLGALSIIAGYPTGEGGFEEMSQIYKNNPLVKAIIRDSMDLIRNDPLGPIYPQFYGYTWLYFFPFVIIEAGRVVDRDKSSKTVDLMLGTPNKPRTIIFSRILAIIVELTILISMTLILIIIGEFYLNIESKLLEQLLTLFIIPFSYGTILCFLIAVSLAIPSPDNRKKIVYALGALTVIFVTLPYFSEPLMPLRFFSLLYYMDLIGLIVQGYQIEHLALLMVLVGVLICSLLFIYKFSNKRNYT